MTILLLALAFLAGLLIGSFLNVCIYRIPRDLSVVAPRSFCPGCEAPIAWHHNIPILSYLWLRGHCARCGNRISLRYPLVELATAILFTLIAWRFGPDWTALKWALFCALLIVLFSTDLEERLLPDECTLGGSIAGLILALFVVVPSVFGQYLLPGQRLAVQSLLNAALGAFVLAVPIWGIGALWSRLRKREALGFGDVKLLALIGIFLGLENGIFALMIASVAGAITGVAAALWKRQSIRTYELPFGCFLCAAAIVVVLLRAPAGGLLGVP
ncbi:MAG TPA: prepilin peptidase [Bryobacteraceae bacterium]|jgi:leader peptidase (prepilin peptidase)/N-methyltransferase|nr:prepilin peptidase [Bryobacteraceae bacterium]